MILHHPRRCQAGVVRAEGFEPPRLSSLEPKSSASTNSATPAGRLILQREPDFTRFRRALRDPARAEEDRNRQQPVSTGGAYITARLGNALGKIEVQTPLVQGPVVAVSPTRALAPRRP